MGKRKRPQKSREGALAEKRPRASLLSSRGWLLGLVLGVTVLAFSNTLASSFAYDDTTQILQNELIRSFSNIPTALVTDVWFWRMQQDKDPMKGVEKTTPYYRPVFVLYLMLGWHLFSDSPAAWHLASVLMHVLAVYFVFLILEKTTTDVRLTAIGTILFAVHPLRSESVAWISGVTDLFLAAFLLPSFYLYLRYREEGRRKLFAGSLLLYALATFSKEPAVCLPAIIIAYEVFLAGGGQLSTRLRLALVRVAGFVAVSAVYFVIRYRALGFLLSDPSYTKQSYGQVLLTIPLVIWKYIGLLLWPVDLSPFHATPVVTGILSVRFILPLLGLVALGVALAPLWRHPVSRFGLLWFSLNLLPVLNLKAFAPEFMVQERYIYIPSVGFSLLVAMGVVRVPIERWLHVVSHRKAVATALAVVVLTLTGKTLAQNSVWKDDLTLWQHGVEAAPDQTMPYYILGHRYLKIALYPDQVNRIRTDQERTHQFELANEQFERYLKLSPTNFVVISNLAASHLYIYQGQAGLDPRTADRAHLDRAIALCEKGLAIASFGPLWDTLGTCYTFDTELKNLDRALACYERGLNDEPQNTMIVFHMGAVLAKKGNYDEALRYLESARDQQPALSDVYKILGYTQQAKGRTPDAINSLSRYLQLKPNAVDAQKVSQDIQNLRALLQENSPRS